MNLPGPSGLNQDQGQVSSSKLILENHCFNQVDEYLSSLTVEERADIENGMALRYFNNWTMETQVDFIKTSIDRLNYNQLCAINGHLESILYKDFISLLSTPGLIHIAEKILKYVDFNTLLAAESVCQEWLRVVDEEMLWKKLIEKNVQTDSLWQSICEHRNFHRYLFRPEPGRRRTSAFYRKFGHKFKRSVDRIEHNWRNGNCNKTFVYCHVKGVYCVQFDKDKIVAGLRNHSIRIWSRIALQNYQVLNGHTGPVKCLQFDDTKIISGSKDKTIRIWDSITGELIDTVIQHRGTVLNLRFNKNILVTCSKDRSIILWDFLAPNQISFRTTLIGHRSSVKVVDFDDTYIVSASGDKTIKIWKTSNADFLRTIRGHRRGISCLQFNNPLIISGSSDKTIRIWHVETFDCIRILQGHDLKVRCLRFDSSYIVSGSYDGTIKIWDLKAALNASSSNDQLCLTTMEQYTGKLFRLNFDKFQIVTCSSDDAIIIWDFQSYGPDRSNWSTAIVDMNAGN